MRSDGLEARIKAQAGSRAEGAGVSVNPSATSCGGEAAKRGRLSRRVFMLAGVAAGAGVLIGCGGGGGLAPFSTGVATTKAWQLSTRGVESASKAARNHAANKRFVSASAADAGRAHAGDSSRIVPIDITPATWAAWFGSGVDCIDLRTV